MASEYLSKGSPVLIEGRLKLDSWEGKDGQKQSKFRVVCDRMQMIGTKGQGGQGGANGGSRPAARQGIPPRNPSTASRRRRTITRTPRRPESRPGRQHPLLAGDCRRDMGPMGIDGTYESHHPHRFPWCQ